MFLFICIYLIIGIVTIYPLGLLGVANDETKIEELKEEGFDFWFSLGVGLGGLWLVITWPYWILYIIYKVYIRYDD